MRWTKEQIKEALEKHLKWLKCEVGGKRIECHDDGLAGANLTRQEAVNWGRLQMI